MSPRAVVSSHRGIISENLDAEFDRFEKTIDERDQKILALLESKKTVDQLVECSPIYGGFPYARSLLRFWEAQMIKKHLEELETIGKIRRLGNSYVKSQETCRRYLSPD